MREKKGGKSQTTRRSVRIITYTGPAQHLVLDAPHPPGGLAVIPRVVQYVGVPWSGVVRVILSEEALEGQDLLTGPSNMGESGDTCASLGAWEGCASGMERRW